MSSLLQLTEAGLYCAEGDFYVDPWAPVNRAVITHAHADHAAPGSTQYLTTRAGQPVLQARLGTDAAISTLEYGQQLTVGSVVVSLHPAGHILGSAQVRIEHHGEVVVVSGDYKTESDATCQAFEPVRCHLFITESTFGLPIYRWQPQSVIFEQINDWWASNKAEGKASLLLGYSLGKAQRLLAGLDASIGPIYTHGAVENMTRVYRENGISLPETQYAGAASRETDWSQSLILAPPFAHGTPWTRRFGPLSAGFASGWMRIRGARRRRAIDRGFVLSDHVDWPALLSSIEATGAERVWVTHGYSAVVVRWLRERGIDAQVVATRFEGEGDEPATSELEATGAEPDREDRASTRSETPQMF
jgi:putative mRNA 3-end processing factor